MRKIRFERSGAKGARIRPNEHAEARIAAPLGGEVSHLEVVHFRSGRSTEMDRVQLRSFERGSCGRSPWRHEQKASPCRFDGCAMEDGSPDYAPGGERPHGTPRR